MAKKGYAEGSKKTQFKKGQKAWNFLTGIRKKRKMKKVNNKLVLNSHYVWCNQLGNLVYVPKGFVIHHIDNDSLNDHPGNLLLLPDGFHKSIHNRSLLKEHYQNKSLIKTLVEINKLVRKKLV